MAAPLATEKVLRGTLQALQRGGLISSGADVTKLETIPNNATDQDISDILDTIVFGGIAASSGVIRSDESVDVFIDADNNESPVHVRRYFRVSEDQSDPPTTDPDHAVMAVGKRYVSGVGYMADLTIGPLTSIATSTHRGAIRIGTDTSDHYGSLVGGPDDVAKGYSGYAGLAISSPGKIGLQSDVALLVTDTAGAALCGGWDTPNTKVSFHVGDFLAATPESLAIERELVGGIYTYTVRPTHDSSDVKRVYFRGSYATNEYRCFFSFGGKAGETYGDPNNFNNPTFMVVGDDISNTANAAYIYDRKTARNSSSEVFTIKSMATSGGVFYYFRILDNTGTGVFNVDSTSTANAPGGFTTGAADVAEVVTTDQQYSPGTVLAIQNGVFTRTTQYRQSNVAGVVATKPGLLLGHVENNISSTPTAKMAITGIIPVMCSTAGGDILGDGECLVSGPDGCAVVDHNPLPGTIIGKAKGALKSDGRIVKGLVEVLVNLQ